MWYSQNHDLGTNFLHVRYKLNSSDHFRVKMRFKRWVSSLADGIQFMGQFVNKVQQKRGKQPKIKLRNNLVNNYHLKLFKLCK